MDLEKKVIELEEQVRYLTREIDFLKKRCNRLSKSKASNDINPYDNWAFNNQVSEEEIRCVDFIIFVMVNRYKMDYDRVEVIKNSKRAIEIIEGLLIKKHMIDENMPENISESEVELFNEYKEIHLRVVRKLRDLIFRNEKPCYQELKKIIGIVLKRDMKEFLPEEALRFIKETNKNTKQDDFIDKLTNDLLKSIIDRGRDKIGMDMCKYLLEQYKNINK